jgi:Predicted membrane protein
MTTYQDQPLQSRRAIRQGERSESSQPLAPFRPPQMPRTAAGEPLSYVTQNRPPLPGYDSALLRGRRATEAEPETSEPQAAEQQEADEQGADEQETAAAEDAAERPTAGAPGFRPRDYSPEARQAPPVWAPAADVADEGTGVVEYHTQARASVSPPAASLAASLAGEPSEQTLTRRELRALREAHGITAAPPTDANPVVSEAPEAPTAPPTPQPSSQLDSAFAEFDALAAGRPAPSTEFPSRRSRRAAVPEPAPEDGLGIFDAPAEPEAAAVEAQQTVEPPQPVEPTQAVEAVAPAPVIPPAPVAQPEPVAEPPAIVLPPEPTPMAPTAFTPPPARAVIPEPPVTTGERPAGHWTRQAALDDTTQVSDSPISRIVGGGSGAITTSALVLPSIPGHDMATGEVMLTDSVSLPANLAATGAHHSIDESDLDHLLDPGDHQAINTDSVPIRAIKAVSSHSGNRQQLIANAKPNRGNRALTALIVSASAMVVVVVTLLVVALATEVI